MATYVLIPGAGDVAWYWHLVSAELRERGHDVVAVDLPCDDESAGWSEYADSVVDAVGDRTDLVVVAQSLGGFTAPLVCERVPVDLMVLVAAMVPAPGETGTKWWANTGYETTAGEPGDGEDSPASEEDELIATFYQDVPRELAAEALKRGRDQAETPLLQPWPLERWPRVPTRFLLRRDDRCFPAEFLRRVVRERLGITPRRDRQRPHACPQPPEGACRPPRGVPGRAIGGGFEWAQLARTASVSRRSPAQARLEREPGGPASRWGWERGSRRPCERRARGRARWWLWWST